MLIIKSQSWVCIYFCVSLCKMFILNIIVNIFKSQVNNEYRIKIEILNTKGSLKEMSFLGVMMMTIIILLKQEWVSLASARPCAEHSSCIVSFSPHQSHEVGSFSQFSE